MNKSTCFLLLALSVIAGSSISCDKNDHSQRIAMLAHGTTFDDLAFLQSCKTGLDGAKDDFGILCDYDIDTTTGNYLKRLEYFGECGYDMIIAVGYMWNDAVIHAAKEYPGMDFVLVDAVLSEAQPNVESITFDVDEVAYPLGYLSAWWAYSHDSVNPAVGFVGAYEIPVIRQLTEPFLNGVDRFNRQYGKTVSHFGYYAGTFIDAGVGGHIADSLITLGADVIFGVGGQTGDGALLKAMELGKWGIGVDVDQFISYPAVSGILISSAMKSLDNAIYALVKSKVENKFTGGGVYSGNLANEGVKLAPYHDYDSQIPDSVKQAINQIKAGIIDGSISTGW